MQRRRWIDTVTNVCLIVTCALVSAAVVQRMWTGSGAGPLARPAPQEYKKGDLLPTVPGLDVTASPTTVLLVLSSQCRYCTESMPFYAKLSEARTGRQYRLIAVGSEPEPTLKQYVTDHGVGIDGTVSVSTGSLKVSGTPTLIIVTKDGRIQAQWSGALRHRQAEVEAFLNME